MRILSTLLILCLSFFSAFTQTLTSSNLPIVVIDTHGASIQDEPKTAADMGVIDNGPGQTNQITDPFNDYSGKIAIEFRGSSSQGFPKKPYGVELQNESGAGISASLLGMPAEEDWAFIATYNDKSLMRDALAYKLARDLGRYGPRTRFCELVINDQYQGVYMIAEKIKRDKNRVDISKLEPNEISGDDLTGGYLLKIDKFTGNGGLGFYSPIPPLNRNGSQNIFFQIEYPKFDEIVTQQRQYIQAYITQFENVLNSSTYADAANGYPKYTDVDSFVDFLIMNEVSKNVDGYRLSTYLYKDKDSDGGKITMGPVWDFNLAFGNADYCEGAPVSGWMYDFNLVCGGDYWLIPFWWKRLLSDYPFRKKLGLRWQELRATKLDDDVVTTYIDSVANVLDDGATARNFSKWPVLGQYVWPNSYVGNTYKEEVTFLKQWVTKRMAWLDQNMPHIVTATDPELMETDFNVKASPNPFQDNLSVDYTIVRPCDVTIELFDVIGHSLGKITKAQPAPGDFRITFDKPELPDGIYYFKARTSRGKQPVTLRVLKQH